MVKMLVKEDEPDKEKRKERQSESTRTMSDPSHKKFSHQRLRFDAFDLRLLQPLAHGTCDARTFSYDLRSYFFLNVFFHQ